MFARLACCLIVLLSGFSAFGLPQKVYDVRTYGAQGDGVTDDTAAIRAAATALQTDAAASGLGGRLYFPPGAYLILSSGVGGGNNLAIFIGLKGVNVISDGATLVIGRQFTTSESGAIFGFYDCTNVTVDGFTVTGPNLPIETGVPHGLNFVLLYQGNRNVSMPNNKVSGVRAGLQCVRESTTQVKSRNVVVGALDASNSIYGIGSSDGCDDVVVHALTTKDVDRSYVAYGSINHTVNVTSFGAFTDDVALHSPLDNVKLSYTSPATYSTTTSSGGHARIRMSFGDQSSAIRNIDIRLHVVYDGSTTGGPAFRLLKYHDVPQTLENLRISGFVQGKPNLAPIGDPNGPIIGTVDSGHYWSGNDTLRNIELSDLRIANSKPVRFILPALKGPFVVRNVASDNAIQLVETAGGRPPQNGLYSIIASTFPNLATYYWAESAEPLDPINAPATMNVPVGWQGHTLSNEHVGAEVTYTLPSAVAGLEFGFVRVNGSVLIRPQPTQNIRGLNPGYALELDTVGDGARLRCVVAGTWEVLSSNGALASRP